MRFFADILLFGSALFLPWWSVLLAAATLFFVFPRFYELFFLALFIDLLYGVPVAHFGNFQFVLSLFSAVLYLLFAFVKRRMRI
jgi:hypothetical protein